MSFGAAVVCGSIFAETVLAIYCKMNRLLVKSVLSALVLCAGLTASAQKVGYDVFVPISKYMREGNADKLAAWFADNLEITILSSTHDSSRNQGRQIMKSFFSSYTPRSFDINHTAGRSNMKYAIGSLNAGGEVFIVTIFVSCNDAGYKIQQLKLERME